MYPVIIAEDADQLRKVTEKLNEGGLNVDCLSTKGFARFVDGKSVTQMPDYSLYKIFRYALKWKHEIIFAEKFLNNPEIIKDWKKPKPEKMIEVEGKDYSEATLKLMIKKYVG